MIEKLNFFILVYNRSDVIPTLNVLYRYGIYDNIYLVVGKDDPKLDKVVQSFCKKCNVLVFDKEDVKDLVDCIGSYRNSLKVCTFARAFVDKFAVENKLRYICLLFDDIMSFQIRYIDDGKVKSSKEFNLKLILERYLELLTINPNIYMVGPPNSAFYIGCRPDILKTRIATHYGNMLIYDVEKPIGPYKACVLEDMEIVIRNSMQGHIGLFPAGLQVNCRQVMATKDAYTDIDKSEYLQHFSVITRSAVNDDHLSIPYSKFMPKIISSQYRKD